MKWCLALTMCLLLPASLALADGDGPARKMTGPKEKPQSVRDFLGQIDLAKLKAVLP